MFVINMKMQLHVCTRLYLCQTNECLQVVVSFLVCSILVLQKKKRITQVNILDSINCFMHVC